MTQKKSNFPTCLGIECGGTRTVAVLADASGKVLHRAAYGPANLRLLSDTKLRRHFRTIAREFPHPAAVAIGMAGARTGADRQRIRAAAAIPWPHIPCHATNDLETALHAGIAQSRTSPGAHVLVLSGTGSCCFGRNPVGKTRKIGGWGHLLGDKGSGYQIGLRSLKTIVFYLDLDGRWTHLGQRVLRATQANEPDELIDWARQASKDRIAALAPEVFAAAARRDAIARDILDGAASSLAKDAARCAKGLAPTDAAVEFIFSGSVLLKQPRFRKQVEKAIRERVPNAEFLALKNESVTGAVSLARQLLESATPAPSQVLRKGTPKPATSDRAFPWDPGQIARSPTEQRNPRSMKLDRLSTQAAIRLMLDEDRRLPEALLKESAKIAWTVGKIAGAFEKGGRLFYTGAGTSGRLGILDASECPPTFRADPETVQGIIAGGERAIVSAVEGAEDDPEAGARAIRFRGVGKRDVVIGITASGRTPFVWGTLWEAKQRGAATVLVCFNPNLEVRRDQRPDRIIAPDIGPEILTGSTRLKSGTATKLLLNLFTTLAMVRIGKVHSNLMVDLNPSNVKLRDRARRIVREITGVDDATAQAALEKHRWQVKQTCEHLENRASK